MKAVILAGGKGTRLMPLTGSIPKPMIKLIDKPVMEYIIELLKKHGFTEIAVTLGYLPDCIIDYFGDGSRFGVELTYFIEDTPLGTAGSVKECQNFLSDDFLVISGDCFTEINLTDAVKFHFDRKSIFTVICQPHPRPVGLGVLKTDSFGVITEFIEKPEDPVPSLVNTGIYIVNKKVLDRIPRGYYDFGKQLLPSMTGEIYAYADYSYWSDIGTLVSYYETNCVLAKKYSEKIGENVV